MKWWKTLFLNTDSVSKIVDASISAGDKLVYTDEEKADQREKIRDWYINLLDSMKSFNVAMRLLAVGVFLIWGVHVLLGTIAVILGFFFCDVAAKECTFLALNQALEDKTTAHINGHFSTIIQFYFGAAGINSVVATIKGKGKMNKSTGAI